MWLQVHSSDSEQQLRQIVQLPTHVEAHQIRCACLDRVTAGVDVLEACQQTHLSYHMAILDAYSRS